MPPAPPAEGVVRLQIVEQIAQARNANVVLFAAPAGFGKTTVMGQYFYRLKASGVPTVWMLLDDADNDVERFLSKVHAALAVSGVCQGGHAASSDGHSASSAWLDMLERMATKEQPFAIFFDDFEQLRNRVVLDLFEATLKSLPAHGQAVLGTRETSRLNIGRWRATGRMVEIGPASLRFSAAEAKQLLDRRTQGLPLPPHALQQLYERSDGWVTALQLAAMTLEHHPDPSAFAAAFSGSNAAVADYLLETVVAAVSRPIREFLLATSVLDELNVELCNAVTGRHDSQQILDELERSNVFLTPIDDDRQRYRYHALFADFLRNQFAQRHPEKVGQAHRAASDWFAAAGGPVPAINHALAAGDFEHGVELLSTHAEPMLQAGRFRLLARWFDALPAAWAEVNPMLALVHASALALTRRQQQALRLLDGIEARCGDGGSDVGVATIRNWVGALRGLALAMMDKPDECLEVCQRYCVSADKSAELPVGMLTNALSNALITATRFDEAMVVLTGAKRNHAATGSAFNMAIAECVHGNLEIVQGRLPDAMARLRGAMAMVTRDGYRATGGSSALGVSLAVALYHNDQVAEANRLLGSCLPFVKEAGPPEALIPNLLFLARCARAMGQTDLSFQRLADLELFGNAASLPRLVATVWLERSKWALVDGAIEGANEYLRQAASFSDVWERVKRFPVGANDLDDLTLTTLRLQVRTGRGVEALPLLKAEIGRAESTRRRTRATMLRMLLSEAMMADGQSRPALRQMSDLVEWAATAGYLRLFIDEGAAIAKLLAEVKQASAGDDPRAARQGAFVDQVLKGMNWSGAAALDLALQAGNSPPAPLEPLSERELQVLRMLERGFSNKIIGEHLFISENTVKVHLRNVNAKLAVSSRTQAVSAARKLGLID